MPCMYEWCEVIYLEADTVLTSANIVYNVPFRTPKHRKHASAFDDFTLAAHSLSCILILSHWYFVHLRKNALKLVVLLSLCIAGSDLTALMFINGGSCTWYSLLTTFFVLAGVLWSMGTCLIVHVHVRVRACVVGWLVGRY